ncbi:MAG: ATP-binding cassette domain-containing protein [Hyphomicrobiaceae bacterium]|nr:ATP-binding cassette domain-containing protein [Hyphomicrobiaceae bacterium]
MLDRARDVRTGDSAAGAAAPGAERLLWLRDVRVERGGTRLLDGVSLEIGPGRPTVVVGPNGAGKTTLLKLGMGLLQPSAGQFVRTPGMRASYVFQKPVMLRRSAAANVAFARNAAGLGAGPDAIERLLALVGLAHLGARPARRLSGGEQQRLAIARALAREPALLFLDEPTASLDPAATKMIEDIVASIALRGVKVVMATHDLGQARRLAGDVILLAGGRVAEHAGGESFFAAPASEAARAFLRGDLVL